MTNLTTYSCLVLLLLCSTHYISAQNYFPRNGDVGIGLTQPAVAMHIKAVDEILRLQSTDRDAYMQFMNIDGPKGYIGIYRYHDDVQFGTSALNTDGKVHLVTNARPKMTIDINGFVGIGTTSPKRKMHLIGNAFRLATSGNSARYLELRTDANSNLSLEAHEQDLYLQSTTHNTFIQPFSGAVGIGVKRIPEGYTLAVTGMSIFEEIHVDLKSDWPDYVFEDDYNRLSIRELKDFIEDNGHLPWFPSAKQMERTGLNVASIQQNSVEAIENITTHVIDLEETLACKEKELEQMQMQMDAMMRQMQAMQTQLEALNQK